MSPRQLVIEVTDIHLKVVQRFRMDLAPTWDGQLAIRAHIAETVTEVHQRQVMPPVPVELLAAP